MSINLILVFDHYGFRGSLHAFDRLRLDFQNYEAFDRLKAEAVPLNDGVDWYEYEGLRHRATDDYDQPITYLAAHTLARHLAAEPLVGWDQAVLNFLQTLPPDTKVVLWWS